MIAAMAQGEPIDADPQIVRAAAQTDRLAALDTAVNRFDDADREAWHAAIRVGGDGRVTPPQTWTQALDAAAATLTRDKSARLADASIAGRPLDRVIALGPLPESADLVVARACANAGDRSRAIAVLAHAVAVETEQRGDTRAYFASELHRLGETAAARAAYFTSLDVKPDASMGLPAAGAAVHATLLMGESSWLDALYARASDDDKVRLCVAAGRAVWADSNVLQR